MASNNNLLLTGYTRYIKKQFTDTLLLVDGLADGDAISKKDASAEKICFFEGLDTIPTDSPTSIVWNLNQSAIGKWADNKRIIHDEFFMFVILTSEQLRSRNLTKLEDAINVAFISNGWQVNSLTTGMNHQINRRLVTFTVSKVFAYEDSQS